MALELRSPTHVKTVVGRLNRQRPMHEPPGRLENQADQAVPQSSNCKQEADQAYDHPSGMVTSCALDSQPKVQGRVVVQQITARLLKGSALRSPGLGAFDSVFDQLKALPGCQVGKGLEPLLQGDGRRSLVRNRNAHLLRRTRCSVRSRNTIHQVPEALLIIRMQTQGLRQ